MPEKFKKNIECLKKSHPEIYSHISGKIPANGSGISFKREIAKNGEEFIAVSKEEGCWINISSSYAPSQEAEHLSNRLISESQGKILIFLGAGSGYVLKEIFKKLEKGSEIIWVEREPALLRETLSLIDLSDVLNSGQLQIILNDSLSKIIDKITAIRVRSGFKSLASVINPAQDKIWNGFYSSLHSAIANVKNSLIRERADYRKFSSSDCRVMVFDSKYFIVKECIKAFNNLGHTVRTVPLSGSGDFISQLLNSIIDFKPDFIFTVNHLGFDEEGKLTSLLSSLKVPFAIWYVDSPAFALKDNTSNVSEFCRLFMWEKTCMESMSQRGYIDVAYLPLAADSEIFKPMGNSARLMKYRTDASFVGNSMFDAVDKWKKKIAGIKSLDLIEAAAVARQMADHKITMLSIIDSLIDSGKISNDLSLQKKIELEAYLTWKATMQYRHNVVKEGIKEGALIYGDKEWGKFIPREYLKGNVDYYSELPLVYNASAVNINCTSFQMNTALNQRVFDCAACGAFLITDSQPDLFELFSEKETVSYKSHEEIGELIKFYKKNETQRKSISSKAYHRVIEEHTYEKRIEKIVNLMRETFSDSVSRNNKYGGVNNAYSTSI